MTVKYKDNVALIKYYNITLNIGKSNIVYT